MTRYESSEEFYRADRRRPLLGEVDFGCHWRLRGRFPAWRVSYVLGTGEIYAVPLSDLSAAPRRPVLVLGVVPVDPPPGSGYRTLDRILEGYASQTRVIWVRQTVAKYNRQQALASR